MKALHTTLAVMMPRAVAACLLLAAVLGCSQYAQADTPKIAMIHANVLNDGYVSFTASSV